MDLFSKSLKKPLIRTAATMSPGFSDEDFYERFKEVYPILWLKICDTCTDLKILNKSRKEKKKRSVPSFLSPEEFLKMRSRAIIANTRHRLSSNIENNDEKESLYHELQVEAKARIEKFQQKEKELYAIQRVKPENLDVLIHTYFKLRKDEPLNVNERLNIIQEVAKYRCVESIRFLKQIQNCERNPQLQDAAHKALYNMHAPNVWLQRKFKGKEKASYRLSPKQMSTPQELLQNIKQSKWQKRMIKDVFISHSSLNVETIKELKDVLNKQGLDCYVDWMNDKGELSRELVCRETAEVIIKRMEQSRALIYVVTNEGLHSLWMPWELGYFHALGKPVFILTMDIAEAVPEYLKMYTSLELKNNQLGVLKEKFMPLSKQLIKNYTHARRS